jgi:hypothetical protein
MCSALPVVKTAVTNRHASSSLTVSAPNAPTQKVAESSPGCTKQYNSAADEPAPARKLSSASCA